MHVVLGEGAVPRPRAAAPAPQGVDGGRRRIPCLPARPGRAGRGDGRSRRLQNEKRRTRKRMGGVSCRAFLSGAGRRVPGPPMHTAHAHTHTGHPPRHKKEEGPKPRAAAPACGRGACAPPPFLPSRARAHRRPPPPLSSSLPLPHRASAFSAGPARRCRPARWSPPGARPRRGRRRRPGRPGGGSWFLHAVDRKQRKKKRKGARSRVSLSLA